MREEDGKMPTKYQPDLEQGGPVTPAFLSHSVPRFGAVSRVARTRRVASGVGLLLEPETGMTIAVFAGGGSPCNWAESELTVDLVGEVATIGKKQLTSKLVFGLDGTEQKIEKITLDSGKTAESTLDGWGTEW